MVYKQILTRADNGVWFADGTYIGRATVGYFFGGGKSGKGRIQLEGRHTRDFLKSADEETLIG